MRIRIGKPLRLIDDSRDDVSIIGTSGAHGAARPSSSHLRICFCTRCKRRCARPSSPPPREIDDEVASVGVLGFGPVHGPEPDRGACAGGGVDAGLPTVVRRAGPRAPDGEDQGPKARGALRLLGRAYDTGHLICNYSTPCGAPPSKPPSGKGTCCNRGRGRAGGLYLTGKTVRAVLFVCAWYGLN